MPDPRVEVPKEGLVAAQEKAREIDLRFNPHNPKSNRGWRGPAHRDRLLPVLEAAAPAIRKQERDRFRDEIEENPGAMIRDIRGRERERIRKVLDKAIFDCGEAAHHGSRAHDGSAEIHEAEGDALKRFRIRLVGRSSAPKNSRKTFAREVFPTPRSP